MLLFIFYFLFYFSVCFLILFLKNCGFGCLHVWFVHIYLQALRHDAYDHYTAIYYLLLDRLRQHRSSFPSDTRIDSRRRRPSTIAEQAMLHMLPSQIHVIVCFFCNHLFLFIFCCLAIKIEVCTHTYIFF